ncbi:MAG: transporter associated domain-containing protein [Pseudomonadota bacterium]
MNERSSRTPSHAVGSPPEKESDNKTWLEKIGHALVGEITTTEQVMELLTEAEQRQVISSESLSMIEGVLDVSEMQVREIMIPRSQMTVLKLDQPLNDILETIISSAHSRFPVTGDNRDDIEGILLAKDLLPFCLQVHKKQLEIKDILRPAVIIPESKRLNVLLKEFREFRNHIAIVVDEYGGVSGLVTIEDVLEEIVGEIEDEYDIEEEKNIQSHSDGIFSVNSLTPIDDFNDTFSSHFSDDEYETIGGVVMNAFGHMPGKGEEIELDGLLFKILKADHRRIYLIRVIANPTSYSNNASNID